MNLVVIIVALFALWMITLALWLAERGHSARLEEKLRLIQDNRMIWRDPGSPEQIVVVDRKQLRSIMDAATRRERELPRKTIN